MTRRPTTSFLEKLVIDNDVHGGEESGEESDHNDDLVGHDRRM